MQNRRKFIKSATQGLILTSLISMSGYLILREESEDNCDFEFICQNCKKNKKCEIPEAQEFRKNNPLGFVTSP